jgi:hypothetical protein
LKSVVIKVFEEGCGSWVENRCSSGLIAQSQN